MTDDHARAELALLRAEFAAFRERVERPRWRFPQRLRACAAAGLLIALTPLAILAASPTFSDLGQAAAVHQPNIQAIGDAGITTGFEDPDHPGQRTYNPKGTVTREEMASFLARTAGLGGNAPVVNARTAQSADTATNAANAGNANTVGGYAPNGLVRVARAATTHGAQIAVTTNYPGTMPGALEPATWYQPVLTLPISAPTAGFVQVTASTTAARSGGVGLMAFVARLRLSTDTTGAGASTRQSTYIPESGAPLQVVTVTWVFPVGAGPQVIVLDAARFMGGTGTLSAFDPTMTAIFVPFAQDGGATLTPAP